MSNLSNALKILGYQETIQQIQLIQLYHACGAFTNGKIPDNVLDDQQAQNIIDNNAKVSPSSFTDQQAQDQAEGTKFKSDIQALGYLNELGQKQRTQLRPTGSERQQMTISDGLKCHSNNILDLLNNLGFLGEVTPTKSEVAALLILGASQAAVQLRIDTAAQMTTEGKIKTDKVILVSGARDLWPTDSADKMHGESLTLDLLLKSILDKDTLYETPNLSLLDSSLKNIFRENEKICKALQDKFDLQFQDVDPKDGAAVAKARADIVKSISEQYNITWPTEGDMMLHMAQNNDTLKEKTIYLVNAPKIYVYNKDSGYKLMRPNTQSTLKKTLEEHEESLKGQDITVISSQPHVKYQSNIVQSIMGGDICRDIQMAASAVSNQRDNNGEASDKVIISGIEAVFSSVYSSFQLYQKEQEKSQPRTNIEVQSVINKVNSISL